MRAAEAIDRMREALRDIESRAAIPPISEMPVADLRRTVRPTDADGAGRFKFLCAKCPTAADCKHAFGRYWLDRSSGGAGCNRQFASRKPDPPKPQPLPPTIHKSMIQGTLI